MKVSVHRREGRGERPDIQAIAQLDGRDVGVCECVSMAGRQHDERAQDWIFTSWLGVEEESQGHGIGRLLLSRALREARAAGYRHASISTAWDNHRAFLFYSNFGYRVVDWTYCFGRDLRSRSS